LLKGKVGLFVMETHMDRNTVIRSRHDILQFFHESAVPQKELLIGIEVERSGVSSKDLSPVTYSGPNGYLAVLRKLVDEAGWKIMEKEGKNILSLKRGESCLHIESDGRIELASKPRRRIQNLIREYEMYEREIRLFSKTFGVRWVSTGSQPFAKNSEILLTERERGTLTRKFLSNKFYNFFTKKTNGIHVNFGFTSEEDAIEKFQTIFSISPVLVAMFANSPINVKRFSGMMCQRFFNSQYCNPGRTNFQKLFLEKFFTFEKWIDFVLQLPTMFIERKGKYISLERIPFITFLTHGFKRHRPQLKDFLLHLNSIWNECRIKGYIEYRGIDCVPPSLLPSVPALIQGITLNSETMKAIRDLTKKWTFNDHKNIRDSICYHALSAPTPEGGKVLDLAKTVLDIATTSLRKYQQEKKSTINVSRLLWPIKEYIFIREQSPAEYVMEMWNGSWHKDPWKLLEWSEK
jgi:glutamate--cysteine ligase